MNDNIQTNVKNGIFAAKASEDLTSKEGRLVVFSATGVALPTSTTDITPYVLVDGDVASSVVQIMPLEPYAQVRIFLKGTCAIGDMLVMADPTTAADKGKVRSLPATVGTYEVVALAEEAGVEGQAVKCRAFFRQVKVSQ